MKQKLRVKAIPFHPDVTKSQIDIWKEVTNIEKLNFCIKLTFSAKQDLKKPDLTCFSSKCGLWNTSKFFGLTEQIVIMAALGNHRYSHAELEYLLKCAVSTSKQAFL